MSNTKNPFEDITEESKALIKDWAMPVPMEETTLNDIGELISAFTKEAMGNMVKSEVKEAVAAYSEKLKSGELDAERL